MGYVKRRARTRTQLGLGTDISLKMAQNRVRAITSTVCYSFSVQIE